MRDEIDKGLAATLDLKPRSGYVDLHAEAVGQMRGDTLGRVGVEAGYAIKKNLGLYAEANALTDRTWNAGAGLRWRF